MITYRLEEQEVVRGLLKHRPKPIRVWLKIGAGIAGMVILLLGLSMPPPQGPLVRFSGGVTIACWLAASFVVPLTARHAVARVVRANAALTEPTEATFDERGIVLASARGSSDLRWTAFKRLSQDEAYFYLHADPLGNVTLLPKRAFDDAALKDFYRCTQYPSPE